MKKIIIVYALSIIPTGIGAVMLPQFIDLSVYSVLPLLAAIYMGVGAVFMYCFGEFNRHTLSRRLFGYDFKYSKKDGESEFDVITARRGKVGYSVYVLVYAIISATAIPFIFFFSNYVKIGFTSAILIISPLIQLIGEAIKMSRRIKSEIDQGELEKKELDEQKRREEMGKWK